MGTAPELPVAASVPPPPTPDTIAAYESTDYFADGSTRLCVRIGEPAAHHRDWLAAHRAASATILTAWNPFGTDAAAADNAQAQQRLQVAIDASGLRRLPAWGTDPRGLWSPEPGFCVLDAAPAQVDDWLRTFRQNAAVRFSCDASARLVWHPALRQPPSGG